MNIKLKTQIESSVNARHRQRCALLCASLQLLLTPNMFLMTSCGRNVIEKYAPENEQEKAELDLERGQFASAQERLERVVKDAPNNDKARSLLAAAYAAQAGVTTLGLIKSASTVSTQGSSGTKSLTSILPTASSDALSFMSMACEAMATIPVENRTAEMKLQYSLFFSSYALLQIKAFSESAERLATLTAEDASKLIITLKKASEASGVSPLSTAVSTLATSIEQAPGTNVEKVKIVLGGNSSGSGG